MGILSGLESHDSVLELLCLLARFSAVRGRPLHIPSIGVVECRFSYLLLPPYSGDIDLECRLDFDGETDLELELDVDCPWRYIVLGDVE